MGRQGNATPAPTYGSGGVGITVGVGVATGRLGVGGGVGVDTGRLGIGNDGIGSVGGGVGPLGLTEVVAVGVGEPRPPGGGDADADAAAAWSFEASLMTCEDSGARTAVSAL